MLEAQLEQETEQESEEHWIAVSDLMSGLMMLFLLIAVMYLVIVERKNDEIERVVVLYEDLREELYTDLLAEFVDDLPLWEALCKRGAATCTNMIPDDLPRPHWRPPVKIVDQFEALKKVGILQIKFTLQTG